MPCLQLDAVVEAGGGRVELRSLIRIVNVRATFELLRVNFFFNKTKKERNPDSVMWHSAYKESCCRAVIEHHSQPPCTPHNKAITCVIQLTIELSSMVSKLMTVT